MRRFSRRVPSLEANALAARSERLRAQGAALVDLTRSNPTAVGLDFADDAALAAALAADGVAGYRPDARGAEPVRRAIATAFSPRFDAERLMLAASSSEAYSWIFKLLCDAGERVLLPRPSYPLLEHLSRLEGLEASYYGLRHAGGWELDLAEIDALARGARALVVVNPNNPTGSALSVEQLEALAALCADRRMALISDEVFYEYLARPGQAASASGATRCLTFTLGGLSKACALPQMKLSWIDVSGPAADRSAADAALELIADTYLSVSAPTLHAAPALLAVGARRRELVRRRIEASWRALRAVVDAHASVTLMPSDGGWSAILRLPALEDEEQLVLRVLEREHVVVHPGYFFDMQGGVFWVVSLLTPPQQLAEALPRALGQLTAA